MRDLDLILERLQELVTLRKQVNTDGIYVSQECPFCDYLSRHKNKGRVFRLNTIIGVGKSYCCNNFFRSLKMLNKTRDKEQKKTRRNSAKIEEN